MDQERNILLKLGRRPAPAFQAVFPEGGINRQFHVSGVSLFVLGPGPLVAGPMSEVYGRSPVHHVSFSFFSVFIFPVAFAPNISKLSVWRFGAGP